MPDGARRRRDLGILALGLVLLVVAVYAPTLRHGFVNLDDGLYVRDNEEVRRGLTWHTVSWALTALHAGNWHPLTWLSLLLDVEVWGYGPFGHHLTNLVLHCAATLVLFGLLVEATGAIGRSAFVAALFAVHPLHVESVAWISERKDVLSVLFGFLALWAYQRFTVRRTAARYALVASAFVLGLLAKPMLVTLPVVFLAWDYWPLGRLTRARAVLRTVVIEKLPLLALSAASSVVTLYAQSRSSAVATVSELPLPARLEQAITSTCWYLLKAVWPSDLAAFYPYEREIPAWTVVASSAVILTIAVAALVRRSGPLITGFAWYLVTLLPVIGIIQVGSQARADRYTYLPLVGIFLLLGWAMPSSAPREHVPSMRAPIARPFAAIGVIALLAYAAVARAQVGYWRDARTLMDRALEVTRDNWLAHNAVGRLLTQEGRLAEAEPHLLEAARLNPEHAEVWMNLGVLQAMTNRGTEAVASIGTAIRLRPGWPEAHFNLARALQVQGLLDDAARHYGIAIALRPNYADAHNNLGAVHLARGDLARAELSVREAARIDPASPYPHITMAMIHLRGGDAGAARAELEIARTLGGKVPSGIERAVREAASATSSHSDQPAGRSSDTR